MSFPNAKSARSPDDCRKLQRVIAERGLCGLANDTKWDELIAAMRSRENWKPRYRYKCVDASPSLYWDAEWFYHLPFPLLSLEWLDIAFLEETRQGALIRSLVIDHSQWIVELLRAIGLEFRKGNTMIRVFGYSPKNWDFFDQ